jgi:hypothetical protein
LQALSHIRVYPFTNPSLEAQTSDRLGPPEFYPEPDGESFYQSTTIIGGPLGPDNLSEGSRTTGVNPANRLKRKQIKRFQPNSRRCQWSPIQWLPPVPGGIPENGCQSRSVCLSTKISFNPN